MTDLYAALIASAPMRRWLAVRSRCARWLYGTPTKLLEVLNALMLLTWAGAILDDRMIALPFYSTVFQLYSFGWVNEAVSAVFFTAFIFAVAGAARRERRADVLSGYALQLSSLLWVAVAANFLGAYPPLNTEVLAYAILALLCWMSGCHLWTRGQRYGRSEGRA